MKITADEAMNLLDISKEDREKYIAALIDNEKI